MAIVIFRPTKDISLGHDCSSGTSGYTLINEATSDGDGTYLSFVLKSTSSNSTSSTFGFDTSSLGNVKINSVKITITARDSDSNVTSSITANLKQGGTIIATAASSSLDTSYTAYSGSGTSSSVSDLTVEISTSGKKSSSKDDDGYIRITQVYVEVDYTEISSLVVCKAVAKDNILTVTVSDENPARGDNVIFKATYPKYSTFEGWFTNEACTPPAISTNPEFTWVNIQNDMTLYAKASEDLARTITVTMPNTLTFFIGKGVKAGGFKTDLLTATDYANLKNGNFSAISSEKVYDSTSDSGATNKERKVTITVPKGCLIAMWAEPSTSSENNSMLYFYESEGWPLSYIPYYQCECDSSQNFIVGTEYRCECTANAGDGIKTASVDYPKLIQNGYATFTATVMEGYKWKGWYKDSSCTILASTDQTYKVKAPVKTSDLAKVTYLTFYAVAEPSDRDYGLYWKNNDQWVSVKQLYVKENGKWVFKLSANNLFNENINYVKGDS